MEEVIEILMNLKQNSGKRLQEILQENYENHLLQDVLAFVFNPFITTGLSKKKINKQLEVGISAEKLSILDIFNYLKEHNTGTDADISVIQSFIKIQTEEHQEVYKQIFTKELKLGITAKTINKVWKNLIPEFNVMLAEKYIDRKDKLDKEKPEIIVTQKLDGIRALAIVNNHNVGIFSRQGKPIMGLIQIENELSKFENGCYDGELLLNKTGISSKELYKQTVSVVNSDSINKEDIIFNVFDRLSLEEFFKGISKLECNIRKHSLEKYLETKETFFVKNVPILYEGIYDGDIIQKLLQEQITLENEGVMINYSNALYQTKRNRYILKVKAMQDCDLQILDFIEGDGKNIGTLGAIIVDYKGFNVKVGSGFTDEDRNFFWKNKDSLKGRIVKVQYFEESSDKNGNLSLRFPVFLELREEGKEISYN